MSEQKENNKNKEVKHYSSISDFLYEGNFAPTEHPHFCIRKITKQEIEESHMGDCSSDFYIILFRRLKKGLIRYGRTQYDFDNGTLLFSKPGQVFSCIDIEAEPGGYTLMIHKDFLNKTELQKQIKKYSFFDYAVNEALHLSPKEEERIINLCENIEAEYQNNQDKFSKEIILSLLETLFKYADRFYQRQFLYRKEINTHLYTRIKDALQLYAEANLFQTKGVPSIAWVADTISVTQRYLSDSIKAETGKTALEVINLFLVEEAKNLLLEPNATISETAYKLGFEYSQYFSRFFKKNTGKSPKEFIEEHRAN